MRTIICVTLLTLLSVSTFGNPEQKQDSIRTLFLDEIVVVSSSKETNPINTYAGSISVLSPMQLREMQIENVKNISSIVPNFFIPDYGSKMTAPVYIRGIGNRSAGQASSLYVDHAPYLNKSTFDFEFADIQRIEVLRGPQGTLFGRNSMGGAVNIFTPSSLNKQETKIKLSGGNYQLFQVQAKHSGKISDNFGINVGGYYTQRDGFFTNIHTGNDADDLQSAGGKLRFDWKVGDYFTSYYLINYDYTDQNAFPYGLYDASTATTHEVDYNDEGSYKRKMLNNVLYLEYKNKDIHLSSTTSYQYLDDDMKMDQDYSPLPLFTLNQKQDQKTFTQEINAKSNHKSNYQWSVGISGFTTDFTTNASVQIKEGGLASIQEIFDKINEENPRAPLLTITDKLVDIPGVYKTPSKGTAIYHQSTYNNLFVDGLSVTAGIRLDYEKSELSYDAQSAMNLNVYMAARPPYVPEVNQNIPLDSIVRGNESIDFVEILPKFSIRYEFDKKNYVYATAAKGYNPGGYNVQIFSDLVKKAMMTKAAKYSDKVPLSSITIADASYNSEYSWNYEIGFKGEPIKDILSTTVSLFYIDIDNMQLTKFVDSGEGRMLANVGDARSKGFEIEMNVKATDELYLGANYGYTHATFSNYEAGNEINYNGKYLPYAPQHTFSVYASYRKNYTQKWIDSFSCNAQYNGVGKTYWEESNETFQDPYGLLNIRAGVRKNTVAVNLWAKNLLNTDYKAFYFESMGNQLFQKGKPLTFGADIVLSF